MLFHGSGIGGLILDRPGLLMSRTWVMNIRSSPTRQIRLFKNERLEKLTVMSPRGFAVTWGIVLPIVVWAGWGTATLLHGLGLFAAGLSVWVLFEYAMHRYLFHWDARLELFRKFVFIMHGNHHADPNDRMRNLMPPIVSLPIGGAVWAACVAVLGGAGTWAFLGFILGYVAYDLTHYACHQWPMKGALANMLKRHHMRHHYVGMNGNFAITALFLDRLFGTLINSLKSQN